MNAKNVVNAVVNISRCRVTDGKVWKDITLREMRQSSPLDWTCTATHLKAMSNSEFKMFSYMNRVRDELLASPPRDPNLTAEILHSLSSMGAVSNLTFPVLLRRIGKSDFSELTDKNTLLLLFIAARLHVSDKALNDRALSIVSDVHFVSHLQLEEPKMSVGWIVGSIRSLCALGHSFNLRELYERHQGVFDEFCLPQEKSTLLFSLLLASAYGSQIVCDRSWLNGRVQLLHDELSGITSELNVNSLRVLCQSRIYLHSQFPVAIGKESGYHDQFAQISDLSGLMSMCEETHRSNPELITNSKLNATIGDILRSKATQVAQSSLRRPNYKPPRITCEKIVGPFVLDFAIESSDGVRKIALEVDGPHHFTKHVEERDRLGQNSGGPDSKRSTGTSSRRLEELLPTPKTKLKRLLLRALGWEVETLTFREIRAGSRRRHDRLALERKIGKIFDSSLDSPSRVRD